MSTPMIERQSQHDALLTRCDACGAAVAVTVVKIDAIYGVLGTPKDGKLQFCQHHYDQHETALEECGWSILANP